MELKIIGYRDKVQLMNNFINVRLEAYNHNKTLNAIKHNIRHIQSKSQKLNFDNMSTDRVHNNSNFFIFSGVHYPMKKNKSDTKDYYNYLSQEYQNNRAEHNKLYKASNINNSSLKGRNLRDNQSTWLEGVFTFSDQFKEDLGNKYSFEELCKVANDCVLDIGKKLNANLKYIVFHGDEKTGHFHYAFDNYDNLGRSLFKKINNINDLSILQDIGFNHFGKLGMKRGQKKEISGVNHQNKEIYWQNKYNELKTKTNTQLKQLNSVNTDLITTNNELVNANRQLNDINTNIDIKTTQLNILDKNILDKIKVEEGYSKLLEDLKISIEEDKNTIEDLKSGVKDLKIEREQLTKDTSKSKEEKKLLYAEITTKQDELRVLKDNIQSPIKYKKDLAKDLNSKIDIVINSSKTLIGLDKDKLRIQIAKLVKHYLKLNTQLKEVDELKEKNEKLENDNILLVEDNSKKDKVITKLKDDNSILNSELNTLKKSELFLKNQLNELKIATQKQLNSLSDTLVKIKDKIGKFKSFILFKGLDKDFQEYEQKNNSMTIECEDTNSNHNYFDR